MSLKKVLVLGSTGILGPRVLKVLSEKRLFAVCGKHIGIYESSLERRYNAPVCRALWKDYGDGQTGNHV